MLGVPTSSKPARAIKASPFYIPLLKTNTGFSKFGVRFLVYTEYCIFGSILGFPYFQKLPYSESLEKSPGRGCVHARFAKCFRDSRSDVFPLASADRGGAEHDHCRST